ALRPSPSVEQSLAAATPSVEKSLSLSAYKLHFQLSFSVDSIAPQILIEGRKARVYFTIANFTPNTLTDLTVIGTVRPQFFPHGLDNVTSYSALSDWRIPVLEPFEWRQGVITYVVHTASKRDAGEPPPNVLVLSLIQVQQPSRSQLAQANAAGFEIFAESVTLATDSVRFDSGARYRLAVTGIVI